MQSWLASWPQAGVREARLERQDRQVGAIIPGGWGGAHGSPHHEPQVTCTGRLGKVTATATLPLARHPGQLSCHGGRAGQL